jgi:hypothetical protein
MDVDKLAKIIPTYIEQLSILSEQYGRINRKLDELSSASIDTAFIIDIFILQAPTAGDAAEYYSFLEADLYDTNVVNLTSIEVA